jgi:hypothetical protein
MALAFSACAAGYQASGTRVVSVLHRNRIADSLQRLQWHVAYRRHQQ